MGQVDRRGGDRPRRPWGAPRCGPGPGVGGARAALPTPFLVGSWASRAGPSGAPTSSRSTRARRPSATAPARSISIGARARLRVGSPTAPSAGELPSATGVLTAPDRRPFSYPVVQSRMNVSGPSRIARLRSQPRVRLGRRCARARWPWSRGPTRAPPSAARHLDRRRHRQLRRCARDVHYDPSRSHSSCSPIASTPGAIGKRLSPG